MRLTGGLLVKVHGVVVGDRGLAGFDCSVLLRDFLQPSKAFPCFAVSSMPLSFAL